MSPHEDRRDTTTQRIPFEAIVEIGTQGDSPAFEAQGVDVSTGGMHLRTAYLPELGHPLLCRFDAPGEEVIAEGNVVWRREAGRGGEFGLRFTRLEGNGARILVGMCGAPMEGQGAAGDETKEPGVDPGTRVRLHIDGLGSPMRARVRGVAPGELMVGSNLEFLRVGRTLDLEDVDRGRKRAAHIERVDVEVDPATHVPQLVVTLRYDEPSASGAAAAPAPQREITPQPTTIEMGAGPDPSEASFGAGDEAVAGHDAGAASRSARSSRASISPEEGYASRSAEQPPADPLHDDEVEAAVQMRSKLSKMAMGVGPKLEQFGAQAKTALAILRGKIGARAGAGPEDEGAPKRTTAPAPSGVLHAQGKRVVREGRASADRAGDAIASPKGASKLKRRMAVGGAAAGVALVLGLVAMRQPSAPPGASDSDDSSEHAAAAAGAAAGADAIAAKPAAGANAGAPSAAALGAAALGAAAAAAAPGGAVTADVPLFGPMTLSAGDSPSAGAAIAPVATSLGTPIPPAMGASAAGEMTAGASSSSAGSPISDEPRRHGSDREEDEVRPLVHGKVVHPVVLRLKTDGEITELRGGMSAAAGALTISVPGRRIAESGADLASRDERLRGVHVTNGSRGAQIVLRFRDGVPPYAVRARGRDVQIALGRDERPEAASRSATASAFATARTSAGAAAAGAASGLERGARAPVAQHGTVAKRDAQDRSGHRD